MLNRNTFFIREQIEFLKLKGTYEILDPETKTLIGVAKEKPSIIIQLLKFLVDKRFLPTKIFIYETNSLEDESKLLFSMQKGITLLNAKVQILDKTGNVIGWLQSKFFSLGGAFRVFDSFGTETYLVKGDWKGWNFKFQDMNQNEVGTITKKWAGAGKELFTSADNYIISLNQTSDSKKTILLLAAGLAVDIVYKEK
ncbi:MAG: phospholipid scramblase-related protein [Elusimicrobiota bacterium]